LLKTLSDTDPNIQATAAKALAASPVDSIFVSSRLEKMLYMYQQTVNKQFTTDYLVESLLSSLQLLNGEE
jgi:hypothetical protein